MYMSNLDFDIHNYTDDELLQLLDLDKDSSKTEINNTTNTFIQKYVKENKPKYYNFFMQIQNHLLSLFEKEDDEDSDTEHNSDNNSDTNSDTNSDRGEFINTEWEPNPNIDKQLVDRKNYARIVDELHNILRRERLLLPQSGARVPYTQGQMNPVLRNIKKVIINVDSHYRALMRCQTTGWPSGTGADCSGIQCASNSFTFADSATDFTFDLSHPVKHVLKLSLYSYEIPHAWYVFDPEYGTTRFSISGECVDISAGNYDPSGLVDAISTALPAGCYVTYNSINRKVTFDGSGTPFKLVFYDPVSSDCSGNVCGMQGPRMDYNLGWLLGFRKTSYSGESTYTGEALIDTYGFRYLFLELDDFNQNRLNQGVISLTSNRDTFSVPASIRCSLAAAEEPVRTSSCGKPPPSWRGPGLTANQVYSRAQILNAIADGMPHRYLSPVNANILARIPVRKFQNYDLLFENWSPSLSQTSREYFGPVALKRMRVRLLNDKGYVINLNGMNFSFSLIAEQLYQY